MHLLVVSCFPQCSPHSPSCQQAFGLTDLQLDPGQLQFVLVCSMLSRCLMGFSLCADLSQLVAPLENKLLIKGALSWLLFLAPGLFQIMFWQHLHMSILCWPWR